MGIMGFPGGSDSKASACSAGDLGSIPRLEDPLEKERQCTLVLLPGKFHGLRSLVDYNPWGRKESDTTERFHFHFLLYHIIIIFSSGKRISPY